MTEPTIEVRPLRATDRSDWEALWRGYLDFYRAEVPDYVTERTFARLCEPESGMLGLVAVAEGDKPAGIAHLVFQLSTWSVAGSCYLEDLYVDPAHRGGHVARALFEAIDQRARDHGVGHIYWHTQQFNAPARSLYDTVGRLTSFVVYERSVD